MKKEIIEITGTLEIVERLPLSYYGNPRYKARIGIYEFYTKTNSMLGYSITNYENKKVSVELGYHYNKLSLLDIKIV